MAHLHHHQQHTFTFDDLYCSEEPLDHLPQKQQDQDSKCESDNRDSTPSLSLQKDADMAWEHQELNSLLSKQSINLLIHTLRIDPSVQTTREEAVDWILKSCAHYGFSPLTAVLAVDYFDRFLAKFCLQRDETWTAQITAVACLSIAAKVEEIHVPSLLDIQEEESEFYFKAKDVQKMELVVLSALRWKMNPVTVVSFLDYFARRLEMEHHLCCEFLSRCETIVLSIISDLRYTSYTPSVMATAITLHVLNILLHPAWLEDDYPTQLFSFLNIPKDNVEDCRKLVMDCTAGGRRHGYESNKRKLRLGSESMPGSPNGVLDICFSPESEGSRDSWAASDESESKRMRRTRALEFDA